MGTLSDTVPTAVFAEQRHRRFGAANPELMDMPYWHWMVRTELNPYQALERFHARLDVANGPDWCFGPRYGVSKTDLPDDRIVFVGGEYEDWYDEQFCVYNDVIVRGPADEITIFGYPRTLFPPTDFHTATLVGDEIILIGNTGYQEDRELGHTPVFALSTVNFRINRWETMGDNPGWISEHNADLDRNNAHLIVVSGGRIGTPDGHLENVHQYTLDLRTRRWHRVPTT